jgi:hypothetical protein
MIQRRENLKRVKKIVDMAAKTVATFINLTPHDVVILDAELMPEGKLQAYVEPEPVVKKVFPSAGVARVETTFSSFDENGVATQTFGEIVGLPEPRDGVLYIVSLPVLERAHAAGRTDVVAPATAPGLGAARQNGQIIGVIGFVRLG